MRNIKKYGWLTGVLAISLALYFIAQVKPTKPPIPKIQANPTPPPVPSSPADPGTLNGLPYIPAKYEGQLIELPDSNLRVDSFQVWRLKDGTEYGSPGDYVLVLTGAGIWQSEFPPVTHLGRDIALELGFVGPKGTLLYNLVSPAVANQIAGADLRSIELQNPGGLARDPKDWASLKVKRGQLIKAINAAKPAKFVRQGNTFILEK